MQKREILGSGIQFNVSSRESSKNVIKEPSLLYQLLATLHIINVGARVEGDLAIMKSYVGEHLVPTKMRGPFVRQTKILNYQLADSKTLTEGMLEELSCLGESAKQMRLDTGYALDWLGAKNILQIRKNMKDDDEYWAIPNLIVYEGKIGIIDGMLMYTKPSLSPVLAVEAVLYKKNTYSPTHRNE